MTNAMSPATESGPQQQLVSVRVRSILPWNFGICFPLTIPIILFIVSLLVPPSINSDGGIGFMVLRSMLAGGPFNILNEPDHADISRDIATFLSGWSPGQYIVPGAFVWLGTSYGLALSLTALIASLIGVIGWAQVARNFGVNHFVLVLFVSGLVSFHFATFAFRTYPGGEIILFAAAPWTLYALLWTVDKPPLISFAIAVLSAAFLFFAKLTGLVCFVTNVLAISILDVTRNGRLTSSLLGIWIASAISALAFLFFWPARDWGPPSFSLLAICFSVASGALSAFSAQDLLYTLFFRYYSDVTSAYFATYKSYYALGPLSVLLIIWVWFRLRHTPYRDMAISLFTIAAIYTAILIAIYYFTSTILYFEERHLRYSGIIFFLLFLVAIDQCSVPIARRCALVVVGAFEVYGLLSYAHGSMLDGRRYYDPLSGTSQPDTPPVVLEYLHSEMRRHKWQRPIATILSPSGAIALPEFRILLPDMLPKAGKTSKIFVVVREGMLLNGIAEMLLRTFVDYDFASWNEARMNGMVVYSQ